MSQTVERRRSGPAVGFIVFAGVAMVMIGAFHALQGLVALFNDDFYVVGQKWIFEFDLTTWGWVHLIVGIGVAVAGFFVFNGAVWARAVGVAVVRSRTVATPAGTARLRWRDPRTPLACPRVSLWNTVPQEALWAGRRSS